MRAEASPPRRGVNHPPAFTDAVRRERPGLLHAAGPRWLVRVERRPVGVGLFGRGRQRRSSASPAQRSASGFDSTRPVASVASTRQ